VCYCKLERSKTQNEKKKKKLMGAQEIIRGEQQRHELCNRIMIV